MMRRQSIGVLLLAAVIGIAGCRGGEKRGEQPVTPSPDVALEEFRQAELERQQEQRRRAREERRAVRQVQIDEAARVVEEATRDDVPRLDAELERLAGKGLNWADDAQKDLDSIEGLDELLGEEEK